MTSQPQTVSGEGRSAGQYLRPLRDLAAYVLAGATALLLFVAIIRLIPSGEGQFAARTQDSFYGFVNLATIFLPLGAVLLALLVAPRHPKAQLIVLVVVVEYAVMAFFGVFFGLLVGLINHAATNGARVAFEELLLRVAWLGVFAVAAYAVFQIWRNLIHQPRPKSQPGVYGQPQYNAPGGYPAQPGYGPPSGPDYPAPGGAYPPPPPGPAPTGFGQPAAPGGYGQPAAPSGYGQPAAPGGYGQPAAPGGYGQPAAPSDFGQPAPNPSWNQPAMPIHRSEGAAYPRSAPPAPGAPASGPPGSFGSPSYPPGAYSGGAYVGGGIDPTQVVPQRPADDRTEMLRDDRPGFGPADQDPPRR